MLENVGNEVVALSNQEKTQRKEAQPVPQSKALANRKAYVVSLERGQLLEFVVCRVGYVFEIFFVPHGISLTYPIPLGPRIAKETLYAA